MTLKEKMAIEASKRWAYDTQSVEQRSFKVGYLEGFEAARGLSQTRFVSKAMVRPKHSEEPDTSNTVVVNGERFEFTMLEDFKSLGEQEVE